MQTYRTLSKIIAALFIVTTLSACGNTIRGVGKDAANAVDATQDAGKRVVNSVD